MKLDDFINNDLKNLVYDFKYTKKSNISEKTYSKMIITILALLCILAVLSLSIDKMYKVSTEQKIMIILIFVLICFVLFTVKQKRKLTSKESDKMFDIVKKQVIDKVFNDVKKVNEKCMTKKMFKNLFFRNINTFKDSDTYVFKDNNKVKFHSAIFTTLINSDCAYYTSDYVSQTYYDSKENKIEVFCKGIVLEIELNIDTKINAYYQSNKNIFNVRKVLKTTKDSWKEKRIEAWNIDNNRKINYSIEISKDDTKKNLFKEEMVSNSKIENINNNFFVYSTKNQLQDSKYEDLYNRILKTEDKYRYSHDFSLNGNKLYIYIPLKEFYSYTLFKSLDFILNMSGVINRENKLYEKYGKFLEITNKQYNEILEIKNNYLKNLE